MEKYLSSQEGIEISKKASEVKDKCRKCIWSCLFLLRLFRSLSSLH